MELEQLRTFRAIAQLGSLTAASRTVNLSQPAVSRQLQALERRLGAPLLERGARGVHLTEAGEAVFRASADVLSRLEDMEAELALLRGGEGGTLRIGATVTVCLYLLPSLLKRYKELYPRQEIVIINERSRQIPELVRDRRIDIGIASATAAPPGVRRVPWRALPMVLLYADREGLEEGVGSSLMERGSALQRRTAPFVLASQGSLRALTEQLLLQAGITPRVVAEADSLEVVKRLVLDGFGYALVPSACVTAEEEAGGLRAFPLPPDTACLPVVLLLRDGRSEPPAVRNFLNLAQRVL